MAVPEHLVLRMYGTLENLIAKELNQLLVSVGGTSHASRLDAVRIGTRQGKIVGAVFVQKS